MVQVYRNAYAVNQRRWADIRAHGRSVAIGHRWGGKGRARVHWGARWPIAGRRRVDGCNNVPYTDYIRVCIHETHVQGPDGPAGLRLAYITVTVRCAGPSAGLYYCRSVGRNVSTSFEYVRATISFYRLPYIESLSNNLLGWLTYILTVYLSLLLGISRDISC